MASPLPPNRLRVTFDTQANAVYIYFPRQPSAERQPIARTLQLNEWINVDYDQDGQIVGVEVLGPLDGFERPPRFGVER